MDLITLKSNMQPGKLIENYDSLVWAERYNTLGDFQITTGYVDEYMQKLPEGTLMSLRESTVPMVVETHEIVRKKNEGAKLIIKGRSFESILDRRVSINTLLPQPDGWNVVAKIPSDVAHYIIYKICVEGIVDPADIFPPDKVVFVPPADYLSTTGPNRQFTVPRGNLLQTVVEFLQIETDADLTTDPDTPIIQAHGIRAIRPNQEGSKIGIEIYQGVDRSGSVYFDATRDMLDDGSYLFSKVGSANAAYVIGDGISAKMNINDATGFDRRVILADSASTGIKDESALQSEGSRHLSQAQVTAMFNGTVNHDLSPYVYGVDFDLGDIVRTVGDYGLDERARVTEYIRTEDANGEKATPTLSTVPSYL